MNSKVIRRAIALSWCVLVACFLIKMLGGNWFSLNITNTYLEGHAWLLIVSSSITSFILFSLYYMTICQVRNFDWWVYLSLYGYFVVSAVLKILVIPANFYVILDLIPNFIIPALLIFKQLGKPKKSHARVYFRIIIAFCLNSGFQMISTIVRDVAVNVIVTNMLTQLIMTFDVFIMMTLYWLYTLLFKKEVEEMGVFFTLLLGKGKEELESMLADTVKKLEADPENAILKEEKEAIEKAIAEL